MIDVRGTTLLVVAPHPDDEVIGCGGLMRKVKSAGGKVYVLYLTVGTASDFSARGASTADERMKEIRRVADFFGFDGWRVAFAGDEYHLQLDQLPQKRLIHEIERGEAVSLEAIRPDLIAFPLADDYNQDHRAAALACITSCRPALRSDKFLPSIILSYEAPMSVWSVGEGGGHPNFVVGLTDQQLRDKVAGMELYVSQVRETGHPRSSDALRSLAALRGSLIGASFAEAYYCHKIVL